MKTRFLIALLTIALAAPAMAQAHRGGGHGGGWRGDWIVPALIGSAILFEVTRPPPVYVQPAPIYAPSYVQGYSPPLAPAATPYWYFCPEANAYYPYVRSCPSGWQVVPTTPPGVMAR